MTSLDATTVRPARRLRSWLWDYLVILVWLAIVLLVIGVPQALGWLDLSAIWSNQIVADVAVTVLTVIPFWRYLVITEAGPSHATWGKRRAGLAVAADPVPTVGRVAFRNLIKVLPWQFGHLSAMRFATGEVTVFAVVAYVVAMVLLVAVALPPLLGRRGLHDLAAGTRVVAVDSE